VIVFVLLMLIAVGLAGHFWRMSMIVNRPEQYERFHKIEKEVAKVQDAAGRRIASACRKAFDAGMRVVRVMFKN
jgi:hypothetical protein